MQMPLVLAAGAGACLCAAGALAAGGHLDGIGAPACPFRTLTGLPCPLCGATRATIAAVSLNPRVWEFNFVWPPLLMTLLVGGILWQFGAIPARWQQVLRRHQLALLLALLGLGWVVALFNRHMILA